MKLFPNSMVMLVLSFLVPASGISQTAPDPILRKICTGSCAGRMASVTAWHNSAGKVVYYEFSGDLSSCLHPPLVLYDSKGREVLTIPSQPMNPKEKEMVEHFEKLHQKRKQLLSGHTPSKPIFCSEISR